jgi:dTMP kinase
VSRRGFYVVFEGIDGGGKSTQAKRLVERLRARGLEVVATFEPTNGPIGSEIRRRAREGPPLTGREELDLFVRDRREHVEKVVRPALARGAAVVQDRSWWSTLAYQSARPGGPTRDEIQAAHAFELPRPDVVLLLDVPVERGLSRVTKRGKADAFEEREYLERVRATFLELAKTEPFVKVDGARSEDEVFADIAAAVEKRLAGAPR